MTVVRPGSPSMATRMPVTWCRHPARLGFTLIEVLVVVAIIALLVSILLPSLSRVRIQTRITICKTNCKQVATSMNLYQTEHNGSVPILFNYGAEEFNIVTSPTKFAENAMLAVALRRYERGLRNLANVQCSSDGSYFLPNTPWPSAKRREFETRLMPDHYACPFGRDKGPGEAVSEGSLTIGGHSYDLTRFSGRIHAYNIFQWEGQNVRGLIIPGEQYPTDPGPSAGRVVDGRPKYSILSWNARMRPASAYPAHPVTGQSMQPAGFILSNSAGGDMLNANSAVMKRFRKWNIEGCQRVLAPGFSDVTVMYCMQGEWLHTRRQIMNKDSHPGSVGGGTNAIFADSHVEWVKGTQIGWQ